MKISRKGVGEQEYGICFKKNQRMTTLTRKLEKNAGKFIAKCKISSDNLES
jgi:hypothetical protein